MECEVLRSFFPTHNDGLNPAAAGFWRFFFIDSWNRCVTIRQLKHILNTHR
jgi:hypothetical protein